MMVMMNNNTACSGLVYNVMFVFVMFFQCFQCLFIQDWLKQVSASKTLVPVCNFLTSGFISCRNFCILSSFVIV